MKTLIILTFCVYALSFPRSIIKKKNAVNMKKKPYDDIVSEIIQKLVLNDNDPFLEFPKDEESIVENSFEGFLRNNFNIICNESREIDFETFFIWRKQIGTLLTIEEISEIFYTITEDNPRCGLIDFIKINIIIDENDGADYS